jgi:hypothetical protein
MNAPNTWCINLIGVNMKSLYKTEFSNFDYDIPQLPDGFVDVSWHNNVSPSFEKPLKDNLTLTLWVDYLEASRRECGGSQFMVIVHIPDQIEDVVYQSEFDTFDGAMKAIDDILANEASQ